MVKHTVINLETKGFRPTFFDLTDDVKKAVSDSGISNGTVVVFTGHTTCSIFFEEYTHDTDICGYDYLQVDLVNGLNKIFPKELTNDQYYRYPGPKHLAFALEIDPDIMSDGTLVNGDAHLKGTLIGSSCTFPIIDKSVLTGEWGHIYLVDWDGNRPRKRKAVITVTGE
ncbi:MAG: YjbQ family protein [Erysipelotrichaceae bacterium]|nr:YjbQ family protein [Erysipelotrichaceae bacterium]